MRPRFRRPGGFGVVVTATMLALVLGPAAVHAATTVPVTMTLSAHPTSGSSFTFALGFPDGFVIPPSATCSWELAWGDDSSLRKHTYDATYGSTEVRGRAADGYCDGWTLTLPYSASAQCYYSFGIGDDAGTNYDLSAIEGASTWPIFSGSNGTSVGSGITSSTLPGVWLSLPKSIVVGDRVTATAHTFGGYVQPPGGTYWTAGVGTCGCPLIASTTNHQLSFTFTASVTGTIAVFYNDKGEAYNGDFAGAAVDPKVHAKAPAPTPTPTPRPTRTPTAPPATRAPASVGPSSSDSASVGPSLPVVLASPSDLAVAALVGPTGEASTATVPGPATEAAANLLPGLLALIVVAGVAGGGVLVWQYRRLPRPG